MNARLRRLAVPALAVLLAALLLAVRCVGNAQRAAREAAAAAATPDAESPRLVALSPGLTETLCMLGLGGHLVGRTPWCDEPPSVTNLPCVFTSAGAVDLAALKAVRPDFVLLPSPLAESPLHGALEKARVSHLAVKTDPLDDMLQGVYELAARFDAVPMADAWLEHVSEVFGRERERVAVAASAAGRTPRVLFVMGDAPDAPGRVRVAGRQSYQSGVIEAIGAENACTNEAVSAIVPRAAVAAMRPDVVVEVRPKAADRPAAFYAALRAWAAEPFPALISGDWHVTFGPGPLRPGPQIDRLAEAFGAHVRAWAEHAAVPPPDFAPR